MRVFTVWYNIILYCSYEFISFLLMLKINSFFSLAGFKKFSLLLPIYFCYCSVTTVNSFISIDHGVFVASMGLR